VQTAGPELVDLSAQSPSGLRMGCMTAICPAGPPKERAATRTHTRVASPRLTPWRGASLARAGMSYTASFMRDFPADTQSSCCRDQLLRPSPVCVGRAAFGMPMCRWGL
jgi:hypothetical protein